MNRRSNSATWMAASAEKDGAKVEWINYNIFIATKNNVSLTFFETRCFDTHPAWKVASNKGIAKRLLTRGGVKVPKGAICATVDEAITFSHELGKPIVIKPVIGIKGRGVSVNLKTREEIKTACVRAGIDKGRVLVEEMVSGIEYRVMILGGKPIAALYKDPANVIGDGNSSVEQLISIKNLTRKKNPNLAIYPIRADDYVVGNLEKQGLTLQTVLPKGEKVYLRKEGNLSAGGESIDVTDDLPSFVYEECVKAANSFPGLSLAGVDVFYDKETKKCHVLEVNTNPGCGGHLFPYIGKPRDVTSLIWRCSFQMAEAVNKVRSEFSMP